MPGTDVSTTMSLGSVKAKFIKKSSKRALNVILRTDAMQIPVLCYSIEFCLNHAHKTEPQAFPVNTIVL